METTIQGNVQWDKVDEHMKAYERYEKGVQRYLLFLMGGMSGLSQYEIQKRFEEAPGKIEELKKKDMYLTNNINFQFILTSDKGDEHEREKIVRKLMVMTSNVRNWLDAASSYVCDSMNMGIDLSPSKEVIRVKQVVCAYMIYRKAKRIQAQEEKRQQRENKLIQKYGWYGWKTYPWSRLNHCRCGNKYPWMHGFPSRPPYNEMVREGALYRVVCHRCFRHTKKGTYQEVVEEWNARIGIDYKSVITEWERHQSAKIIGHRIALKISNVKNESSLTR